MPADFARETIRVRVSLGGGGGPRWSADGTRLMYRARQRLDTAVVATVRTSPDFEILSREAWLASERPGEYPGHELHPDGDRILVERTAASPHRELREAAVRHL